MDTKTLIKRLRARDDVVLIQGKKHIRIMTPEGRQLAVVSTKTNHEGRYGRAVTNLIKTLKREGVDVTAPEASEPSDDDSYSINKTTDLYILVTSRLTAIGWPQRRGLQSWLARYIYDMQNVLIRGGSKFASFESAQQFISELVNGRKKSAAPWSIEIVEAAVQDLDSIGWDHVATEVEATTTPRSKRARGRKVEITFFADKRRFNTQYALMEIASAFSARKKKSRDLPYGKGTFMEMAEWAWKNMLWDWTPLHRGGKLTKRNLARRISDFIYGPERGLASEDHLRDMESLVESWKASQNTNEFVTSEIFPGPTDSTSQKPAQEDRWQEWPYYGEVAKELDPVSKETAAHNAESYYQTWNWGSYPISTRLSVTVGRVLGDVDVTPDLIEELILLIERVRELEQGN